MGNFLKKFVKSAGKTISKAKNVLLPLAGVAVGLALPGIGGAIGGAVSKIGTKGGGIISKITKATGIADGKPGVLGIGTGKGILEALKGKNGADGEDGKDGASATGAFGGAQPDGQEGLPGWLKAAGIGLALFAATR